jgi:hypothetical protein
MRNGRVGKRLIAQSSKSKRRVTSKKSKGRQMSRQSIESIGKLLGSSSGRTLNRGRLVSKDSEISPINRNSSNAQPSGFSKMNSPGLSTKTISKNPENLYKNQNNDKTVEKPRKHSQEDKGDFDVSASDLQEAMGMG